VSAWQRIPPGSGHPLGAAAARRRAVWLPSRAQRDEQFPAARTFPGGEGACAALPLELDQQLLGVLLLEWERGHALPEGVRRALTSVAELCAGPIAQLLRDYDDPLPGMEF